MLGCSIKLCFLAGFGGLFFPFSVTWALASGLLLWVSRACSDPGRAFLMGGAFLVLGICIVDPATFTVFSAPACIEEAESDWSSTLLAGGAEGACE